MISCLGLWTRTVAQYLLGWASILPTTWEREEQGMVRIRDLIPTGNIKGKYLQINQQALSKRNNKICCWEKEYKKKWRILWSGVDLHHLNLTGLSVLSQFHHLLFPNMYLCMWASPRGCEWNVQQAQHQPFLFLPSTLSSVIITFPRCSPQSRASRRTRSPPPVPLATWLKRLS